MSIFSEIKRVAGQVLGVAQKVAVPVGTAALGAITGGLSVVPAALGAIAKVAAPAALGAIAKPATTAAPSSVSAPPFVPVVGGGSVNVGGNITGSGINGSWTFGMGVGDGAPRRASSEILGQVVKWGAAVCALVFGWKWVQEGGASRRRYR